MARPSDLDPRGVIFNSMTLSLEKRVLSTNNIVFNDDRSVYVTFLRIKKMILSIKNLN